MRSPSERFRALTLVSAREQHRAAVAEEALVDREAGGGALVEEPLRLAGLAEPDVLVPVELEGGRQVVDLGQAQLVRPDAGLLVGGRRDRVAERQLRRGEGGGRVGGEV